MTDKHRRFLGAVRAIIPRERVYTDYLRRLAWGTDAGFYRLVPQIVVRAAGEEEVVRLMQTAARLGVPLTFRAAGTSLSGQAVSDSVLVVAGKHWERGEVRDGGCAGRLQPGVVGARVNEVLKPYGYRFPPDPASIRSAMVGGIVMNVTSVAFVSKYLETGMPLTTKRLTVDGDIVKQPKNVEVIIGTPIQELLDFCGGLTAEPGKILYGGPMMGTCVADLSQPILKNNNAILAFSQERAKLPKASNCIQCGRCVNACPLGLAAKDIVVAFNKGNVELLNQLHADLCMSCGTCSFVCPAKRPLTPSIALAKIMMKNGGKK